MAGRIRGSRGELARYVREHLRGREFQDLPRLVELGETAIPVLSDILIKDDAPILRMRAALVLGQIGTPEAAHILTIVAFDRIPEIRVAIAKALGEVGGSEAENTLMTLLRDEDASVRKWVIRSLARVGGPKALSVLHASLNSEREDFLRDEISKAVDMHSHSGA